MVEAVAKHHPEGPTIYTLKLWVKAIEPSETTVGRLIKALSAVYRNAAAEVLEEYCQVNMQCYCFFSFFCDWFNYRPTMMIQVQNMVSSGYLCHTKN